MGYRSPGNMETYRGKPGRDDARGEFRQAQDRSRRKDRTKGKVNAKRREKSEKQIYGGGGVRRKNMKDSVFEPNGLRENAETAISCRGPGPARKKKEVYR